MQRLTAYVDKGTQSSLVVEKNTHSNGLKTRLYVSMNYIATAAAAAMKNIMMMMMMMTITVTMTHCQKHAVLFMRLVVLRRIGPTQPTDATL